MPHLWAGPRASGARAGAKLEPAPGGAPAGAWTAGHMVKLAAQRDHRHAMADRGHEQNDAE